MQNDKGATLLHIAASNGYNPVVLYLLQQPKIDIDARDPEGNTPLHLAAFFLQYETVMHLATHGADVTGVRTCPSFDVTHVCAARNRFREKPIIVTEDTTMIRLLSSLEKHAQTSGDGHLFACFVRDTHILMHTLQPPPQAPTASPHTPARLHSATRAATSSASHSRRAPATRARAST